MKVTGTGVLKRVFGALYFLLLYLGMIQMTVAVTNGQHYIYATSMLYNMVSISMVTAARS